MMEGCCFCALEAMVFFRFRRLDAQKMYAKAPELYEILDVSIANGVITLMKPFHHKTLEERAAEYDGKLMLDGEYDWGDPLL